MASCVKLPTGKAPPVSIRMAALALLSTGRAETRPSTAPTPDSERARSEAPEPLETPRLGLMRVRDTTPFGLAPLDFLPADAIVAPARSETIRATTGLILPTRAGIHRYRTNAPQRSHS